MIVYLSGPMRGYPRFNFPLFLEVAAALRAEGVEVRNPAEHDLEIYPDIESWEGFATGDPARCPKFNLPDSLEWDFDTILDKDVNGIALLPGWEQSAGAKAERFISEAVGKQNWLVINNGRRYTLVWDPRKMLAFPTLKEEYNVSR